jgi:hypothetical protein
VRRIELRPGNVINVFDTSGKTLCVDYGLSGRSFIVTDINPVRAADGTLTIVFGGFTPDTSNSRTITLATTCPMAPPDYAVAPAPAPSGYLEQQYVYNCDGTNWAFRFHKLPDGSVSISYGYAPPGGDRSLIPWQAEVSLGGVVVDNSDVSAACIIGRVWVFARGVTPIDGSARLYERHGLPDDLANGYGGGFTDGWYHWR